TQRHRSICDQVGDYPQEGNPRMPNRRPLHWTRRRQVRFCAAPLLSGIAVAVTAGAAEPAVQWTANGAPSEAMITAGPWTLEQSGAANGLKSAGYCDSNGNQVGNPGTGRMQPYYFPTVVGQGRNLQGYFDWRPKDIDEAVAAAVSHDGGHTWTFQQKVL